MGLRRWLIFLLLVSIPLLGFAALVNAGTGPYTLTCQNLHAGFQVVLVSLHNGQASAYAIPFGSCPPG